MGNDLDLLNTAVSASGISNNSEMTEGNLDGLGFPIQYDLMGEPPILADLLNEIEPMNEMNEAQETVTLLDISQSRPNVHTGEDTLNVSMETVSCNEDEFLEPENPNILVGLDESLETISQNDLFNIGQAFITSTSTDGNPLLAQQVNNTNGQAFTTKTSTDGNPLLAKQVNNTNGRPIMITTMNDEPVQYHVENGNVVISLKGQSTNCDANANVENDLNIVNTSTKTSTGQTLYYQKKVAIESSKKSDRSADSADAKKYGTRSPIGTLVGMKLFERDRKVVEGGEYKNGVLVKGSFKVPVTYANAMETVQFDTNLGCDVL